MNGTGLGDVLGVVFVLVLLALFGYFYDREITRLGNQIEGFVWLSVVIGVFVTLIAMGILDVLLNWNSFFIGFIAYAASGSPMVCGAIIRFLDERDRARKAALDVIEETMAK